jgi:hypothetical protein
MGDFIMFVTNIYKIHGSDASQSFLDATAKN